jgi:NTP pyrophosphatase (non-canonical NTP hydrolase)
VLKLLQELGELSDHVCKDSHEMLIADDLGDMMVVMINIMARNNLSIEECLEKAYNDIKDRKGKMVDGIFVKEETTTTNPIPTNRM